MPDLSVELAVPERSTVGLGVGPVGSIDGLIDQIMPT